MPIRFPFDKFKKGLIKNGLKETAYNENLSEWIEKYGDTEQSKKDYVWHVYQTLLMSVAKDYSHDLQLMYEIQRNIYCEMFGFLCQEGKNIYVAQKGILNCDLQLAALGGLKMNVVIIGGNLCQESMEINGKTFPLEVMLKCSILPYDKCEKIGGCNCTYGFIPLRDENDRLIKHQY